MSEAIISVENISKEYRLGTIGSSTFYRDVQSWTARLLGKDDPNARLKLKSSGLSDGWYKGAKEQRRVERPGYFWALSDVSFEVRRGEILGIIGKNGAGKSTLLKILSRVTSPTAGLIKMKGRVASLLEVGTGFHPELTGRENVFLNGAILGLTKGEIVARLPEIVDFSELGQFVDTPVKRYSSGMYMRLAFSVAAHLEPDILIVDEVLAVGDASFQQKCMGKMSSVARTGRTILLVSHNMTSVNNLCHRAILISKGQVIREGLPTDLTSYYLMEGGQGEGEKVWSDVNTAPGDETARLRRVAILQEPHYLPTASVDVNREIIIEFEYHNYEEGQRLYTALHLLDHMGAPLLSSSNFNSTSLTDDPWTNQPHPVGRYKTRCIIPAFFLNYLTYSITPILGRYPVKSVGAEVAAISFTVNNTGEMSIEDSNLPCGVIRPKLAWQTNQLKYKQ
jgi:lipopolysaccharide transport system ATP-binding protein